MTDAAQEWRQGWPLLVASAVGCGFAATHAVSLGAYIGPLAQAFGWTREQITGCLVFGAIGTILLTPVLGSIVDRIGARRVALVGVPAYALAHTMLGTAGPSIASWYVVWGILAILCMGISPVAWSMAVASRFDRNRGMALAIVLAGMSATTTVIPLLTVELIENFGWRASYWITALIILVVAWPLTWAFFYDARDLGRKRPPNTTAASPQIAAQVPGVPLRAALASIRFWQISFCMALVGGAYSAIYIHFQPMLTDSGISPGQAALLAGIIGPVSFASRLITGLLLDRFNASLIAASAFALPIASCFLLQSFDGDPATAAIAITFTAIAAGSEIDLMAFLASRYFGMRSFGTIYGCIFSIHTMCWAAMPPLAGRMFDATGSYDQALMLFAAMFAAGALLAATLGRFPQFTLPGLQANP